jgi:hypothetical protein
MAAMPPAELIVRFASHEMTLATFHMPFEVVATGENAAADVVLDLPSLHRRIAAALREAATALENARTPDEQP